MKAVVAAFNQEKALVGAFSVITNIRMELFEALVSSESPAAGVRGAAEWHWSWRRRPLALVISHDPSLPPDQRTPSKEISITAGITKCRDSWGIVRDNWKSRKEIS